MNIAFLFQSMSFPAWYMRIFLLLLLFLPGLLQAHHKLEVQITNKLSQAQTDTARVRIICELSNCFFLSDANKALKHALIAEKLAVKINFLKGKIQAKTLIGYSHMVAGEYAEALKYYFQALELEEKSGNNNLAAQIYLNIGSVYRKLKDMDRARYHYAKAFDYASNARDSLLISKVYNNWGNVYEDEGDYAKALSLFKQAAALQAHLNDTLVWAKSLHNIGNIHTQFSQPQKGLSFLFQSLRLNEQIHNERMKLTNLASIANIYHLTGNPKEALRYALQGYALAIKTKSDKQIALTAKFLQQLYGAKKDYESAYKFAVIYQENSQVLDVESQKKISAGITLKYESYKKDLENKALKAEAEKQEIHLQHQQMKLVFGGVLLIAMLILMVILYDHKQKLALTNQKLQDANRQMHIQNKEIHRQKEELSGQADLMQQQNEQLVKDNIFKNTLFSIISHDLRSPFVSITAFINLMKVNKSMSAELKPIIDLFGRDISILTNMITNLLAWSKAQLNGDKLNLVLTDLFFLADENIELFAATAKEKNITIINEVPDDSIILTDKERLDIIIRNLVGNAIKFTPNGGEVRLQVKEQSDTLALVVNDNGRGISDKYLAKLFAQQRFTTLGTSKERGSGLGLLLCKELAASIHADIAVESQEGKGSSFSIMLPKLAITGLPKQNLSKESTVLTA